MFPQFKTILVPTDFSQTSEHALSMRERWPPRSAARCTCFTWCPTPWPRPRGRKRTRTI